MYQAFIIGHGKRVQADSLKLLTAKLARERIRIGENELNKQRKQLDTGQQIVISAMRKLSQSEITKKRMRPQYLANPFLSIEDTERVQLRIMYVPKSK